jgi:hypothetical protein
MKAPAPEPPRRGELTSLSSPPYFCQPDVPSSKSPFTKENAAAGVEAVEGVPAAAATVGVDVAVPVAVGVNVGLAVGVSVGAGVAVGVRVGVEVAV